MVAGGWWLVARRCRRVSPLLLRWCWLPRPGFARWGRTDVSSTPPGALVDPPGPYRRLPREDVPTGTPSPALARPSTQPRPPQRAEVPAGRVPHLPTPSTPCPRSPLSLTRPGLHPPPSSSLPPARAYEPCILVWSISVSELPVSTQRYSPHPTLQILFEEPSHPRGKDDVTRE